MTGEELFLNELNIHIINGVSKKDLTDLIKERVKQLTISDVSDNERSEVAVCAHPFGSLEWYDENSFWCIICKKELHL
jgi:hypothetical protein